MSTKADCFFADFEWEGIQPSLKMTRLNHGGQLVTGSTTAIVERDESYRLRCEVQGFSDHPFAASMEVQKLTAGEFSFSGDGEGRLTTLSNCFIEGMDNKVDCDSGTHKNNTFTLRVHTDLAEQKTNGSWSEMTHTDWFLNGPNGHIFIDQSERDRSQTYSRKIKNVAGYVFQVRQGPGGGFSADCIVVSLPEFCFIVRKVPKEFGPTWSQKLAIDYCKKVSPIPPEEAREATAEFVSFIFGRRLIDVGDACPGNPARKVSASARQRIKATQRTARRPVGENNSDSGNCAVNKVPPGHRHRKPFHFLGEQLPELPNCIHIVGY